VQRKSKDVTQCKGGKRQRGISEDEDSGKLQATVKGTAKTAKLDSINGEDSDMEREVSDSEAEGNPKEERKNRSSKSSKKGRTRNSSSSSDGSPEPKGRKVRAQTGWEATTRVKGRR
jgi:hypothetical protein